MKTTTGCTRPDAIRQTIRRTLHVARARVPLMLLAGALTGLLGAAAAANAASAPAGRPAHAPDVALAGVPLGDAHPGLTPELLADLRNGGLILACRHAATDYGTRDENVNFADASSQRVLSEEGVRQAEAFGREIRRLGLPFGEVLASAYQRTFRSAELMFGRATVDDALYGRRTPERTRALMTDAPAAGTNRALVTHQGLILRTLDRRGPIGEADCLILRPSSGQPVILAHVRPEEWTRAER